jgi:hypothetical protein
MRRPSRSAALSVALGMAFAKRVQREETVCILTRGEDE